MTEITKTPTTPGLTKFCQGDEQPVPLFGIEAGIPCQHAREQASELLDYAHHLSLQGVMEGDQRAAWAAYYLSAMAKALLDDAELGLTP
ncbi:hypothetical protein CCOS865_04071 [Pseudomonas reidholzensis]|uniref:DUF3077 domain-containing protein n=1 Tax=Pseudomonas reidholzensis TaxID=1785162 RepID=A0A383RZB0_9PSED|nr:DUF3077 domain-containing protein [Pseudomonas reidholzensis]SYX91791.1 hypothetical protein CCOS865_04071 [Pseudomonas reidholzensis]